MISLSSFAVITRYTFQQLQLHGIEPTWIDDACKAVQGGLVQSAGGRRAVRNRLSVDSAWFPSTLLQRCSVKKAK